MRSQRKRSYLEELMMRVGKGVQVRVLGYSPQSSAERVRHHSSGTEEGVRMELTVECERMHRTVHATVWMEAAQSMLHTHYARVHAYVTEAAVASISARMLLPTPTEWIGCRMRQAQSALPSTEWRDY